MDDLQLDFDHFYSKRSEPRYRSKPIGKRSKQKVVKKRKKKKKVLPKEWDDSLSNLKSYKLSPTKQLEKKLNAVSKHRHYAKDLIQEQKRKHSEQRRLAQEEKEIEQEQKQLIRRKQMLLRKHPMPHFKRTFPVFTAGRNHYDDETESDDDDDDESDPHSMRDSEEEEDDDEEEEAVNGYPQSTAMTLKALSSKLSKLENELEVIRVEKDKNIKPEDDKEKVENINEDDNDHDDDNQEENNCDLTLDLESINKTLQAAKEKKSANSLHIKLPSMPNISQPPQLTESSNTSKNQNSNTLKNPNEDTKINAALHSLDVSSLMMLLDKLKVYFKEIQAEKKQNEEFRSTLLESVNAQNTQILHLLSQLASQQKEIDTLKNEVSTLNGKLHQYETSNMKAIQLKNSEPQWIKHNANDVESVSNEIGLKDIRNIIEESRPNRNVYKENVNVLKDTDWKSISNVLPPKNDTFEYNAIPQRPYTVQKHQKKRSFLPSQPMPQSQCIQKVSGEQVQRIGAPQPVPKPMKVDGKNNDNDAKHIKQNANLQSFVQVPQNINHSTYSITNYPKVRVERYHQ